jgi:hypothetical protein
MTFKAQSLLSHALYFFVKRVHFLVVPLVLRFRRLAAAQLLKRFLNREFGSAAHVRSSS